MALFVQIGELLPEQEEWQQYVWSACSIFSVRTPLTVKNESERFFSDDRAWSLQAPMQSAVS